MPGRCLVALLLFFSAFATGTNLHPAFAQGPGTIITLAGGGVGDGLPATQASLSRPGGIVTDGKGNLFVSDTENQRVRKVAPDGTLSTFAGTGTPGFSGDNGPATAAKLWNPQGLAVDGQDNLYIADSGNNRVRKVTPDGTISTVAGSGPSDPFSGGFGGDGGPAVEAQLYGPSDVGVDGAGSLYVADTGNNRIRLVTPDGKIATYAGGGDPADGLGDGGPATGAALNNPTGIYVNSQGTLDIADNFNNRVRVVGTDKVIRTVAGNGEGGDSGDGGPAPDAGLNPSDVLRATDGSLYISTITDASTGEAVIRRVTPDQKISSLPGTSGTIVSGPLGVDAQGGLLFSDGVHNVVRKLNGDGSTPVVVGGGVGDGRAANLASLNGPQSVALDPEGNLYIADTRNHRIRKIGTDGIISTVAGGGTPGGGIGDGGPATDGVLDLPLGVGVDDQRLLIADTGHYRVRQVDLDGSSGNPAGTLTSLIGTGDRCGIAGPPNDTGSGGTFCITQPTSVVADKDGNLYVSDSVSNRVVKVAPNRSVTKFAGTTTTPYHSGGITGDGGPAVAAQMNYPTGLAIDGQGNVYIVDTSNNRIRMVDPQGIIHTVAGGGLPEDDLGDGLPATEAKLSVPSVVAVDAQGNLYIADKNHHRIRKVSGGIMTTLAGGGTPEDGLGDGGPAWSASLDSPTGVAVDAEGNVYVADNGHNRVRKIFAGEVTPAKGDVNLDGALDVSDAVLTLRYIVNLAQLSPAQKTAADVSGDSTVDVSDAVKILRVVVGIDPPF